MTIRPVRFTRMPAAVALAGAVLGAAIGVAPASEWAGWRGPRQNGVSDETGLISSWSPAGENLAWRADFVGRSTPIVFDGRACAMGRVGSGVERQEVVACFDAGDGRKLWEVRFNVYHTAVPFSRAGWATMAGDPETGNLYALGVAGRLLCLDRKGKVVWSRALKEQFGLISGYGGRTHSPIVDESRVVVSFANSGWGAQTPPRHRTFAFDKRNGELLWVATPGGPPLTITTQSIPVVAVIAGRRLLIEGNADGWVHAIEARTGEKIWSFQLSKQGLNTSVVVDGDRVFATSGDENLDEPTKGRIVAIDGTGTGDVTKTHELWRANEIEVGFASPMIHEGTLYVLDDSANLFALDSATGTIRWRHSIGTVGKAGPVWADGKIYATEVNGTFHILRPEAARVVVLDSDLIKVDGQRYAEIYAAPAVAYGRVYFTTEEGFYGLGKKGGPFKTAPGKAYPLPAEKPAADGKPARIRVVPAEVTAKPGRPVAFRAMAFDGNGAPLGEASGTWGLEGLAGSLDEAGRFTPDAAAGMQAGSVTVTAGGLRGSARVRVFTELPWQEDFESIEVGRNPSQWIGGVSRFLVKEKDGGRVLEKPFMDQGIERSNLYIGPAEMRGYSMQADLMGSRKGRRRPDMGILAGGYTLDLMGNHQRLQIRDWAELRLEKTIDFPWEPDVWYTMKLQVDHVEGGGKAVVRGKVWRTTDPEPPDWTISVEDPAPVQEGSPGLYGYSAADIFYDNVKVRVTNR